MEVFLFSSSKTILFFNKSDHSDEKDEKMQPNVHCFYGGQSIEYFTAKHFLIPKHSIILIWNLMQLSQL